MVNIVGQNRLIQKINTLTLDTFPHSLMLVGKKGMGKHTITQYISKHFNIDIIDISNQLSDETIDSINSEVYPHIYIIYGSISQKEESIILKFLEEPLKNAYIILLCDNISDMLNTIINRCQVWYLQAYSREELEEITLNNNLDLYLLEMFDSPGQILKYGQQPVREIMDLCNKIIDKINIASIPNTLTLANKLSYKDEVGYEADLFFQLLLYCVNKKFLNNALPIKAYLLTKKLYDDSFILHVDKKQLFEHYLIDLKNLLTT